MRAVFEDTHTLVIVSGSGLFLDLCSAFMVSLISLCGILYAAQGSYNSCLHPPQTIDIIQLT